jgi:hypothetical protein
MFQLRKWNKGTLHRQGGDLQIAVSPPRDMGNGIVLVTIALLMVFGLYRLFAPALLQVKSLADLLWKVLPALGGIVERF